MADSRNEANELNSTERILPARLKRFIRAAGAVLLFIGIPPTLNLFCIAPLILIDGSTESPVYVLVSLMLALVTVGVGGVIFYHANQSLNGKPSKTIRLPSMYLLMNIFIVLLILGIFVNASEILPAVFIPPLLFLAAALPPVWAISWIVDRESHTTASLTWRRGVVAFAGGASASLFISILLETLLTGSILVLGFNLFDTVTENLGTFLNLLSRAYWTPALTTPGFTSVLLLFALISPVVEEFAKPLVTLPVLRHLNRQETFLIGAIAGAGFAVLENYIYATIGIRIWVGFLFVCALGSAIQPLGSGLVALSWWGVLQGEPGAWRLLAQRFGVAIVIHAIWNAGALLLVAVGEAFLSGNLPRELGLTGLAALGMLFIFLTLLGSSALWLCRALGQGKIPSFPSFKETPEVDSASLNQVLAIWALACLMVILPAGIIISRLWLR